jgi:hypothetical protein
MEAKDTVKKAGELCQLVCSEFRSSHLCGKICDGLDCEICQLTKQAGISFKSGQEQAAEVIFKEIELLYQVKDNSEYFPFQGTIGISKEHWEELKSHYLKKFGKLPSPQEDKS